jgi:Protein of unknown function (DUF3095)
MLQPSPDRFFSSIPPFTVFREVAEPRHYRKLPNDWIVGVADIVDSTGAIARGGYKAVNMVGASIICALMNGLGHRDFPFVFGGDGATFALPSLHASAAREIASAVQTWAAEEMGLTLRVSLVPLQDIRRAGHDVLVARFAVSSELSYAMFSGGGIAWAERKMKDGEYALSPAPAGTRPDLTGLSCRWEPINAERGEILSVLVLPQPRVDRLKFTSLISKIMALLGDADRTRPVSSNRLHLAWPSAGLSYEARALQRGQSFFWPYVKLAAYTFLAWVLFRFDIKLGDFDPRVYRAQTERNSDFRKFDDGLKLTLDLDAPRVEALTSLLESARREGTAFFGLHSQARALMTCIVPSPLMRDHLHFIDGAGGGYAKAAESLKLQMRSAA